MPRDRRLVGCWAEAVRRRLCDAPSMSMKIVHLCVRRFVCVDAKHDLFPTLPLIQLMWPMSHSRLNAPPITKG